MKFKIIWKFFLNSFFFSFLITTFIIAAAEKNIFFIEDNSNIKNEKTDTQINERVLDEQIEELNNSNLIIDKNLNTISTTSEEIQETYKIIDVLSDVIQLKLTSIENKQTGLNSEIDDLKKLGIIKLFDDAKNKIKVLEAKYQEFQNDNNNLKISKWENSSEITNLISTIEQNLMDIFLYWGLKKDTINENVQTITDQLSNLDIDSENIESFPQLNIKLNNFKSEINNFIISQTEMKTNLQNVKQKITDFLVNTNILNDKGTFLDNSLNELETIQNERITPLTQNINSAETNLLNEEEKLNNIQTNWNIFKPNQAITINEIKDELNLIANEVKTKINNQTNIFNFNFDYRINVLKRFQNEIIKIFPTLTVDQSDLLIVDEDALGFVRNKAIWRRNLQLFIKYFMKAIEISKENIDNNLDGLDHSINNFHNDKAWLANFRSRRASLIDSKERILNQFQDFNNLIINFNYFLDNSNSNPDEIRNLEISNINSVFENLFNQYETSLNNFLNSLPIIETNENNISNIDSQFSDLDTQARTNIENINNIVLTNNKNKNQHNTNRKIHLDIIFNDLTNQLETWKTKLFEIQNILSKFKTQIYDSTIYADGIIRIVFEDLNPFINEFLENKKTEFVTTYKAIGQENIPNDYPDFPERKWFPFMRYQRINENILDNSEINQHFVRQTMFSAESAREMLEYYSNKIFGYSNDFLIDYIKNNLNFSLSFQLKKMVERNKQGYFNKLPFDLNRNYGVNIAFGKQFDCSRRYMMKDLVSNTNATYATNLKDQIEDETNNGGVLFNFVEREAGTVFNQANYLYPQFQHKPVGDILRYKNSFAALLDFSDDELSKTDVFYISNNNSYNYISWFDPNFVEIAVLANTETMAIDLIYKMKTKIVNPDGTVIENTLWDFLFKYMIFFLNPNVDVWKSLGRTNTKC